MNNSLSVFTFNNAQQVRVETDPDGSPWFCAKDVCDVLGYTNSREALSKHCRAKGVTKRDTLTAGGRQPLTFIDEGNLYRLILKSRLPAAVRFEAWVCDEVLPALRKTGTYTVPSRPKPYAGAEVLTANDQANLRRAIWRICVGQPLETAWVRTCWQTLRQAVGIGPSDPFAVDHLPLMLIELRRLCHLADIVREATDRVNIKALQVIVKGGDVAALAAVMRKEAGTVKTGPDPLKLAPWAEQEFARLAKRETAIMDHLEVEDIDG